MSASRRLFFSLVLALAHLATGYPCVAALTTERPVRLEITDFDQQTVTARLPDGRKAKVKRSLLEKGTRGDSEVSPGRSFFLSAKAIREMSSDRSLSR